MIKKPLQAEEVRTICSLLAASNKWRDLALFRLGVDTMLRASDLVRLKVSDVLAWDGTVLEVIEVRQKKTSSPVRCLLTPETEAALVKYFTVKKDDSPWIFPGYASFLREACYRRLLKGWIAMARLDPALYSTHSVRRAKASEVYRKTHNIEAVRQLLGHSSLAHTQRYLGVASEEALALAGGVAI
jgi:integrase